MANDQSIIIQGYLQKWRSELDKKKSDWQSLYFVLVGPSNKNAARLDWYETQEQFIQSPGTRKALFMEEIQDCRLIPFTQETKELFGSPAKYLLEISTYRTSIPNYVLKCSSHELQKEWFDHLKDLLEHIHTISKAMRTAILDKTIDSSDIYKPKIHESSSYGVQIDDTAAAIQCELQGFYRLLLSHQHITLADENTGNPVITWMYKYIRRFGYSDKSLTIEGGSRCGIGQGLFIFKTDRGTELMQAINERMQLCKNQSEDEYSYIPFSKPKKPTLENILQQDLVNNKRIPLTKQQSNNSLEKPSPAKKPLMNVAQQNRNIALSHQMNQTQPKMSEVLTHMPQQNMSGKEDEVYGYSHLAIKGTAPKSNVTVELENPYGEQLIQKIQISNEGL